MTTLQRISAVDRIKEEYISELELAGLLGVTKERIRDLRSKHKTRKINFIDSYSPSANMTYFKYSDVRAYIEGSKNEIDPESKKKSEKKSETT